MIIIKLSPRLWGRLRCLISAVDRYSQFVQGLSGIMAAIAIGHGCEIGLVIRLVMQVSQPGFDTQHHGKYSHFRPLFS